MTPVVTWTGIAALGCLAAAYGVIDAYRDLRALRGDDSGRPQLVNGRRTLAWSAMRGQSIRFVALALWVGLGGYFLLQGMAGQWNGSTVVLVLANLLFSVNALLDARDRIRIRDELVAAVQKQRAAES